MAGEHTSASRPWGGFSDADGVQLGMGMFVLSNLVGSTIQITTLPLPVLSTLQAVCYNFQSEVLRFC